MDLSTRNLRYLSCERYALHALLVSGALLWFLLPIGMWDMNSYPYRGVWALHIVCHLIAVAFAVRLLFLFWRAIDSSFRWVYAAGTLLLLIPVLAQALLPIVSRDALIYHLAVPKLWLEQGRIHEIGWHEWSHFPLLTSLGYSGFLQQGLDRLTALYHASYLLLAGTTAAAFVYYKFQKEELALATAFVCCLLPICLKLAAEPMADLALACFFGLGFALFVVWGEQKGSLSRLIVIGFIFGLGLCTKYNSLLAMLMFGVCMLAFLQRWNISFGRSVAAIGILAAAAALVYLPWPLRNYFATGNPVYPFATGLFAVSDELPFMGSVKPIAYRLAGYGESWLEVFLVPLRMLVTGRDDDPRQFDGLLSPVLLLSAVPLLLRRSGERRPPWIVSAWIYAGSYYVLSLTQFYALVRYQAPLLVPIAALTAAGLYSLGELKDGVKRELVYRSAFVFQILWAGWYETMALQSTKAVEYWATGEPKEFYLSRRIGEMTVINAANRDLPKDAVLYLLFTGNRYYYYERGVRGSYFSQQPIVQWFREKRSADYIAQKFGDDINS